MTDRKEDHITAADRPAILIAEDNPVNRKLAAILVEKIGHPYETVSTGRQAVEAIKSRDFGLVFMDVQMPEMDGFEATAAIRQLDGSVAGVPIVAMTAHAMTGERERCINAGMDDYLTKPVLREHLAHMISKWLHRDGDPPTTTTEIVPDVLDRSVLAGLREMQGESDPDIVSELIDLFLDLVPTQIEEIKSALETGDSKQVEHIAHSIKGSCRNLGARRMGEICNMLEQLGAKNFTRATPFLVAQLEAEFERVVQALELERTAGAAK